MQKYRLIISDVNTKEVYVTKDYYYLSRFDFKVHSSVLFLLSAEKLKKMAKITKEEYQKYLWNYNRITTELKTITNL